MLENPLCALVMDMTVEEGRKAIFEESKENILFLEELYINVLLLGKKAQLENIINGSCFPPDKKEKLRVIDNPKIVDVIFRVTRSPVIKLLDPLSS